MTRRRVTAALCAAAALVLSGCVTPATGADSYRSKALSSVQAATSETETVRIVLRSVRAGGIFTTTADETVTASESALGSISAAFGSVQPPRESDHIHDTTSTLLSDAEDAVVAARIAVRRHDGQAIGQALAGVRKVIKELASAEKRLS
jgi:hypothetical protein